MSEKGGAQCFVTLLTLIFQSYGGYLGLAPGKVNLVNNVPEFPVFGEDN